MVFYIYKGKKTYRDDEAARCCSRKKQIANRNFLQDHFKMMKANRDGKRMKKVNVLDGCSRTACVRLSNIISNVSIGMTWIAN